MERHELKRLICESNLPLQEILDKILEDLENQNRIWVAAHAFGMAVIRAQNKSQVAETASKLFGQVALTIAEVEPDAVNIPVEDIRRPNVLMTKSWSINHGR